MKSVRMGYEARLRKEMLHDMVSKKRTVESETEQRDSIIDRLSKMQERIEDEDGEIEPLYEDAVRKVGNDEETVRALKRIRLFIQKKTVDRVIDLDIADFLTESDKLSFFTSLISPVNEGKHEMLKECIWILIDVCSTRDDNVMADITKSSLLHSLSILLQSNIPINIISDVCVYVIVDTVLHE